MPPQLETHHGTDQINHHGDKEEDDGSSLASLRSAEGAVHAIVEDWVGAEPTTGRVSDIDNSWEQSSKLVILHNIFDECFFKTLTAKKIYSYHLGGSLHQMRSSLPFGLTPDTRLYYSRAC